ncbi:MAG: hypothetical protein ACSHX8_15400 [Opitutaceae bacterium]
MNKKDSTSDLIIRSMKHSVANALERKRRLGQYAVVARNGKLTRLQPEEIKPLAAAEDQAPYNQ